MDWFGKSTKVEGKNELESIGIRFQPIEFHPDRNEYELSIQLPGCPRDLVKLIYDKPSGKLKLQGKKRTTEFVHHFTVPTDCLATGIYGRFRGDVLRIIMPRLLSERPPSEGASSKQEDDDQKASSDPEATEQVGKEREKLPARLPESSRSDQKSTDKLREGGGKDRDNLPGRVPESTPSDQKSTDKLREGGGKDRKKLPARVPEPSPSDQKSTDKSTEGGRKDGDKSPAGVLLLPPPPSDQETTEKFRQRDNELVPEITASQPSVRELRENYQKNISQNAAKPPPPPPAPPRGTAPAPWNRIKNKIISRKEEKEDREPSSDRNKAEQGDVEPEKSLVISQKKEVDTNAKIVAESEAKEKREEKKPSAGGKGTLWVVAKVKETGKAAVAAAMKEENRPVVVIGAAVLALVVIGASWRSSSKKTKN